MSYDNFNSSLLDLFLKQKNCDVKFSCPDSSNTSGKSTISAHKLILSLASDVFDAMFFGEASKNETSKESNPINVDDIQMPGFKMFLSFIYKKTVEFESPEIAAEFYYASHKYNSKDALNFIKDYMLKEINSENAAIFYDIAYLYDNIELKEACIKIFQENTTAVITSSKFLSAEPKTIETIFKLDSLSINSEMELVYALERYIKHNEPMDKKIAVKVRPALNHIRLLTLSPKLVSQITLLNPEDILTVIGCLPPEGDTSKMPPALSSICTARSMNGEFKDMVRKLSEVYSTKLCFCGGRHAIWNCSSYFDQCGLKGIYEKYNHVWLMDYDKTDLKTIYDMYKAAGYIV